MDRVMTEEQLKEIEGRRYEKLDYCYEGSGGATMELSQDGEWYHKDDVDALIAEVRRLHGLK
jgi:hypothetical protein